jgi:amidase
MAAVFREYRAIMHPLFLFIGFIIVSLAAGCRQQDRLQESFQVEESTIEAIQKSMESGQLTAGELVSLYLERIETLDSAGPNINSILEVNPDAIEIAEVLDAEREAKGARGPMHGVPVIIKESIQTGDRMQTTAGSLALEGLIAPEDAFVVRKLRDAGAIILAKANLHEFSFGFLTVSSRGGQTRNPYSLDHYPGGSSGGTAASIAANLGAVGIGEDTGGSIRVPASFNSLVGIRPTLGLVSRAGIVPLAPTRDIAGPMTRTVADAAVLLGVIAGYDPEDPATAVCAGQVPDSYTQFLDRDGLKGARIGVLRAFFGTGLEEEIEVSTLIEAAIEEMAQLGAEIVDPVSIPHLDEISDREKYPFQGYTEFKFAIRDYLTGLGPAAPVRTLEEIIATGRTDPALEGALKASVQAESLTDPRYLETVWVTHRLARQGILVAMADHGLDALVHPAVLRPPAEIGKPQLGWEITSLSPRAGFPSIVVPAGFTREGLPVGIEFLGREFSEPRLLALAYSFEKGTRHRRPPSFPR